MTTYQQVLDQFRAQTRKQSSVKVDHSWVEGFRPVFPDRRMVYVDSAKPGGGRTILWSQVQNSTDWVVMEEIDHMGETEKHEHDRIWDLLVLAAESSRYER